jgi:alkanesulfonate monooxygenase SsuD/methylene tetrahydromethanopterin reductase-like flavin-dependent oxidoreductase (luciferase family)
VCLCHAERERCGLAPAREIPIIKELHVGSDDASAMEAVRPYLEDKYKAYVRWGQSEVLPEGDTLRQDFEQLALGGRFIVGGPQTCARQVREHLERLGATTFLFRLQWPGMPQELVLSSMRRAAEQVFPQVRPSSA